MKIASMPRGVAMAFAAFGFSLITLQAVPADDAAALAAKAEALLDAWDGDAKPLEQARALIEQAAALDPQSSRLLVLKARHTVYAGTTEEGIRPSAASAAHGMLFRAVLEQPNPDARAAALLGRLRIALQQDQPWRYLKMAERADAADP